MKILFDHNTPAPLARWLKGHDVTRTRKLGWQSLENGNLLDVAEAAGFEVMITWGVSRTLCKRDSHSLKGFDV